MPPAVRGLGQSDGFTMELQNTGGLSQQQFNDARDKLLAMANADPVLASVRLTELPDIATLRVDMDQQKLSALGLTQSNANATLTTAWGGTYVNDFIDRGRVKRVYVQGDAQYRAEPEDLKDWFVRGSNGQMVPFSPSSPRTGWATAPTTLSRFNGISSFEYQVSARRAKARATRWRGWRSWPRKIPGTSVSWAGLPIRTAVGGAGAAALTVCRSSSSPLLAALYEAGRSRSRCCSSFPLGLIGAIAFVTLRGLTNDVYLQIGLLRRWVSPPRMRS